jgi:hypothetical protein
MMPISPKQPSVWRFAHRADDRWTLGGQGMLDQGPMGGPSDGA